MIMVIPAMFLILAVALSLPAKNPGQESEKEAQHNTDNDHGSERKVKPHIFTFDADIAGKLSQPSQAVGKKPQDNASQYKYQSDSDQPFSKITGHKNFFGKVKRLLIYREALQAELHRYSARIRIIV